MSSDGGILTRLQSLGELADLVQSEPVKLTEQGPCNGEVDRALVLMKALHASTGPLLRDRLLELSDCAEALAAAMDFQPLYKPERHLYAIGANLGHGNLDGACYDLLASESCLTSYLNVARGDAPRRHWFQLGRPYIHAAGRIGLISWGGTMFEI